MLLRIGLQRISVLSLVMAMQSVALLEGQRMGLDQLVDGVHVGAERELCAVRGRHCLQARQAVSQRSWSFTRSHCAKHCAQDGTTCVVSNQTILDVGIGLAFGSGLK